MVTFSTRGTVKAKEKTVQSGVRKSWIAWNMSRFSKLPFKEYLMLLSA